MQMGRHAAQMIGQDMAGKPRTKFHYFDKGDMATIGRHAAVANVRWPFKAHWGGTLAWLSWVSVHLFFLVGFRNRFIVFFVLGLDLPDLQPGSPPDHRQHSLTRLGHPARSTSPGSAPRYHLTPGRATRRKSLVTSSGEKGKYRVPHVSRLRRGRTSGWTRSSEVSHISKGWRCIATQRLYSATSV